MKLEEYISIDKYIDIPDLNQRGVGATAKYKRNHFNLDLNLFKSFTLYTELQFLNSRT